MTRKIWIALIAASLIMTAMIPVSNAESSQSTGGIEPYKGLVGADSPFYGLKLLYQKLDLSFEGNPSKRMNKHLALAQERLAEAYAAALNNNTGAVDAALTEYENNFEALNSTMDNENIPDDEYVNASDDIQYQQNVLMNLASDSMSPTVSDLISQTLITAETIKNGRPFIWCDNTSTAYFLPPGQMKKIEAAVSAGKFGTNHTPTGLGKKGYVTPEPLRLENGTIVWPWDGGYIDYVAIMNSNTGNDGSDKIAVVSELTKHGKGNGKGNGSGKGNGKK
jgi:hypothetical protein